MGEIWGKGTTYETEHVYKRGKRRDSKAPPSLVRFVDQRIHCVHCETRDGEPCYDAERQFVISANALESGKAKQVRAEMETHSCVFFSSSLRTCLSNIEVMTSVLDSLIMPAARDIPFMRSL